MSKPLILVSNDDGIEAPGLQALCDALEPIAEVWVGAPAHEQSATSHAISLHTPLRISSAGERRFAIHGTPTDSVYMALHHVMPRRPDLVVSGINRGANLGNDVHYSGTVAAAMEGALYGHPALAVSLCLPGGGKRGDTLRFDTAAEVARGIAMGMLKNPPSPGVILNVNVPNAPLADLLPPKLCRLGFTDWADVVEERHDPRGRPYYWIGGDRRGFDEIIDSDTNAIAAGHVSVTPIHYDITDYRSFDYVRELPMDGFECASDSLGNGLLDHPANPRTTR